MEKRTREFHVKIEYDAFEPGEYVVDKRNNKIYKVVDFIDPINVEDAPMVGVNGSSWRSDSYNYRLATPEEIQSFMGEGK